MAVLQFRNVLGGSIPLKKGTAAAAIIKGCPVYRDVSNGKITAVATNGVKLLGFALSASTAADQEIDYVPLFPGVEALLDFSGTYAAAKLGTYVAITVTGGVPVANLDKADADALKLEDLVTNDSAAAVYRAWCSAASTANQTVVEVA